MPGTHQEVSIRGQERGGTLAGNSLENFRRAVESLGQGFLAPTANRTLRRKLAAGRLAEQSFLEQIVVITGRLAFLLAADKWGRLNAVSPRTCFSSHLAPDLAGCELAGEALLEAIRRLSPGARPGLHAGELGAAVEALLGFRPAVDLGRRELALLPADGSQRKRTGSYYTPRSLIDCLLDSCLEPVIRNALRQAASGGRPRRTADRRGRARREQALLSLRICDPACGAGYFLTAAAGRLARHLAVVRSGGKKPASAQFAAALRDVVGQCVYGVDINPAAVELCRLALQIELLAAGAPPVRLDGRILCGDALTGAVDQLPGGGSGFDVVIGNPPYRAAMSAEQRRILRSLYPLAAPACNSAADFIELCRGLVRPGGRVGLVVPKSLTYSYAWRALRASLAPVVTSAVDVRRGWNDVLLEQVLLTFSPAGRAASRRSSLPRKRSAIQVGVLLNGVLRSRRVEHGLIERLGILPTGLDGRDLELLECMLRGSDGTMDRICSTRRGTGLQRLLEKSGDIPAIGGRDIRPFGPLRPQAFVRGQRVEPGRVRWTQPPQAIFQNIIAHVTRPADHIRMIGTIARERVACLDTVNLLALHSPIVSPWGLCALLMSDLVNWFVYACVYNKAVRTMHFDGYFLAKIPAPVMESWEAIEHAASALAEDPGADLNWKALNQAAFEAYAMPSSLRRHVPPTRPAGR